MRFMKKRYTNVRPLPFYLYYGWLGGSVVERRSLTGELSLVCTGPAADGNHLYG